MRNYLRRLCWVMAFILCITSVQASGETNITDWQEDDPTVLCRATIDDEFMPDCVLVSVKKNYSQINRSFTPADFPDVELDRVEDLTAQLEPVDYSMINMDEFRQILRLSLKNKEKEKVLEAVHLLEKLPFIQCAEPNYIVKYNFETPEVGIIERSLEENRSIDPNDIYLNGTQQYYHAQMETPSVWNFTTGSSNVVVGVIDTGIDATHPDLSGQVDTLLFRNFTDDGGGNLSCANEHGTCVAGVIGGAPNDNANKTNSYPVSGICPEITLVSLRAMVADGSGLVDWSVSAINYAQSHSIPIINCSFSREGDIIQCESNAISNYGGLVVCGAGNEQHNIDNIHSYPAGYSHNNIISVMAINQDYSIHSTTNYGATAVDLAASGDEIYTTTLSTNTPMYHDYLGQTSAAAPMVTGVAALLKSYDSTLTTAQIKAAILNGVVTQSNLSGKCQTEGRLNAYRALQQVTGKLKNYYTEVNLAANSNYTNLSCGTRYNIAKIYRVEAALGGLMSGNLLPLDFSAGKIDFIRYPHTTPLTAGGLVYYGKFSMLASETLLSNDITLLKINPTSMPKLTISKYLIGDINNDGSINSSDALLATQAGVGIVTLTTAQQKRGDVNFDGSVNSADAGLILSYSVSSIRTFR